MGFGNVERGQQTEKSPVKAGKLTCEDRIDGLGGPDIVVGQLSQIPGHVFILE